MSSAIRNEYSIVFFVFTEEAGFALFKHTDHFEVVATHTHLRSRDVRLSWEQRIRSVDADDYHVCPLLIIRVRNEATFFQRNVNDACVVGRNALRVTPAVVLALVSDVVIKRAAVVSDVRATVLCLQLHLLVL